MQTLAKSVKDALSSFRPSSNPDELVMSDVKLGVGQREPTADKKELEHQVCEYMEGVKANLDKVRNFFQKSSVRYAVN